MQMTFYKTDEGEIMARVWAVGEKIHGAVQQVVAEIDADIYNLIMHGDLELAQWLMRVAFNRIMG